MTARLKKNQKQKRQKRLAKNVWNLKCICKQATFIQVTSAMVSPEVSTTASLALEISSIPCASTSQAFNNRPLAPGPRPRLSISAIFNEYLLDSEEAVTRRSVIPMASDLSCESNNKHLKRNDFHLQSKF